MQKQIPLWKEAVKRGIKVAMGTDQSHRLLVGQNLVEMEFMVKWLGMSEMEAIVSSTSRAAQCIERPELGSLAPGKVADVLVVDGDPLQDIAVLQQRERLHLIAKEGSRIAICWLNAIALQFRFLCKRSACSSIAS
jgi:imidazolonepropionase-like amidohydrolase